MFLNKIETASSPPVEAPIATIGKTLDLMTLSFDGNFFLQRCSSS
jgi:hypothetical protein